MSRRWLLVLSLLCPAALALSAPPWATMEVVGEAKLRFALWDIYQATLYAPEARYQPDAPFALSLQYLRDFRKAALIRETRKQWQALDLSAHENVDEWLARLDALWVDVSRGDTLTLLVDDEGSAHFYVNRRFLGSIGDAEFSRRFASIWLSESSTQPHLRRQLLGEAKQ